VGCRASELWGDGAGDALMVHFCKHDIAAGTSLGERGSICGAVSQAPAVARHADTQHTVAARVAHLL